jgi:amino acid transporter
MNPKTVFVREATGLVREFSWVDAFYIGEAVQGAAVWSVASEIIFVLTVNPGADLVLSMFLAALMSAPLAMVYYLLASAMPRSGGDYVWISRLTRPVLGFVIGWAFWASLNGVNALNAWLTIVVVLPVFLVSLGYGLGMPGLVNLSGAILSSNLTIFILSVLFLAFAFLISGMGARVFRRFQTIMFALVVIGTVIAFGVLATSTSTDFANAIRGYGGTNLSVDGVIDQAKAGGWSYAPLTLTMTLLSLPLSMLTCNGFTYGAAVSGEVRNPRKSMMIGILGSLAIGAAINVIGVWLAVKVIGYDFLQASNFLYSSGQWPTPAQPYLALLVSPLIHNSVLLILVQLGWICILPMLVVSFALVTTRYTFAFSFDRVLPTRLSEVSERFHAPMNSVLLNVAVGACVVTLVVFTPYLGLFLNFVTIWCIAWFASSVAAMVIPFSRFKHLVKGLPGADWKIPLVTIIGAVSMVLMAIIFYFSVTTPAIGPSTLGADLILATIFGVGALIYIVSYFYNKARGIDLKLVYSEIPPE